MAAVTSALIKAARSRGTPCFEAGRRVDVEKKDGEVSDSGVGGPWIGDPRTTLVLCGLVRIYEPEAEGTVIVVFVTDLRGLCMDLGAGSGGRVCTSEASVVPSRTITSMASLEVASDCMDVVSLLLGT